MAIYVCIRKCFWEGQIWKPEQLLEAGDKEEIPAYFVKQEDAPAPPSPEDVIQDAYKAKAPKAEPRRPLVPEPAEKPQHRR